MALVLNGSGTITGVTDLATAGVALEDAALTDPVVTGGIYLGGTGAANYLDDYEEGTWTPVSGGQNMTGTATYTKVGRLVTVTFDITANSSASAADSIYGLPFAVASNHAGFTIGWTTTASGIESGYFNCLGTDMRLVQAGSGSAINIAANERIIGSGSYFTS